MCFVCVCILLDQIIVKIKLIFLIFYIIYNSIVCYIDIIFAKESNSSACMAMVKAGLCFSCSSAAVAAAADFCRM
jgi:hypothetical protein